MDLCVFFRIWRRANTNCFELKSKFSSITKTKTQKNSVTDTTTFDSSSSKYKHVTSQFSYWCSFLWRPALISFLIFQRSRGMFRAFTSRHFEHSVRTLLSVHPPAPANHPRWRHRASSILQTHWRVRVTNCSSQKRRRSGLPTHQTIWAGCWTAVGWENRFYTQPSVCDTAFKKGCFSLMKRVSFVRILHFRPWTFSE